MLENDAQRIATAIMERVEASGQEVSATVRREEWRASMSAPGASRPRFIVYTIELRDPTRLAVLPLDEAEGLLADTEGGWDADRLFDAVRACGVPVTDPRQQ